MKKIIDDMEDVQLEQARYKRRYFREKRQIYNNQQDVFFSY